MKISVQFRLFISSSCKINDKEEKRLLDVLYPIGYKCYSMVGRSERENKRYSNLGLIQNQAICAISVGLLCDIIYLSNEFCFVFFFCFLFFFVFFGFFFLSLAFARG
jgi:hypothetical protein